MRRSAGHLGPFTCFVGVEYARVDGIDLCLEVLGPSPLPTVPVPTIIRIDGCRGVRGNSDLELLEEGRSGLRRRPGHRAGADAGSASGTLNTIQQVGGSFGVAVIGVIFYTAATDTPTPATIATGLHLAVAGSATAILLAGLTALLHRTPARSASDADLIPAA